ncbi:MAG: sulfite oxidase-like oxidoreductase [Bacillaceae bacterium]|nr:sulfite oxidase-like oxidoreductase [Bacillaceae bacterium]
MGSDERNKRDRVPPNQRVTTGFPVLHYGDVPKVDLENWDLRVFGLVEEEKRWTWEEFLQLPQTTVHNDIHCVTGWSKLDNTWEGVLVRDLLKDVKIKPEARYVMLHAEEGWTTNLPLEDFMRETSLLARKHNGEELTPDHGWPLRAVVPHLYFWKSAKWVRGIEFMKEDREGFWERNGYHRYGDPWKEQRFAWD